MSRSRSVHLRLLHSQCTSRGHEFPLGDFERPGLNTDLGQTSMEDERKERKGINHGRYRNFGNLVSASHCRDGAGDHVDHERRGAATYRIRPRRARATSFTSRVTRREKLDRTRSRREREFSPSSAAQAHRRNTVSLLDICVSLCGPVPGEKGARRDSIERGHSSS
jgi:hypothetical protein